MTSIIAPNPFPIVPIIAADREALYGGLISAAHPIAYARRMADTLPDNDGSLQMLARYRLANASPEFERLTARIAEVVEEDGGCWHACSGCQESNEGYVSERDYPYSPLFKCQPGGGCHECGGIGVLWSDGAFLASYGDALNVDCTCQHYPTHCANDCPTHGLDEPTYTVGERVDAPHAAPTQGLNASIVAPDDPRCATSCADPRWCTGTGACWRTNEWRDGAARPRALATEPHGRKA